jgi:phosphoenolpyruvate carboxylase
VNLAEQHHRIRRARAHAVDPASPPQRGSLEATLLALRQAGIPADRAREALRGLEVTLTLTAHPTEAARRTVLEKLYRIARRLEEGDRCRLTPAEQERSLAAIREEVTALWQTDEVRRERPSVGDEVKNVAWYIEEILWDLLPELSDRIARAFARAYGEPLGPAEGPAHAESRPVSAESPLRIHSWVGGDMDGNPLVTPDVLADALLAYRVRGLRRLLAGARDLGGALSQSSRHVTPPPALLASLDEDAAAMPGVAAHHAPRTEGEPWRRKMRFIEARLAATLALAEGGMGAGAGADARADTDARPYAHPAELARDLQLVADTLAAARCARSGERQARALLERVRALGFSIAELEVRAPADDARAAADALAAGGRAAASLPQGAARLLGALEPIAQAQREAGEAACRTLILSMTQGAEDVLAALRCARAAGLWDEGSASARIDIVPPVRVALRPERQRGDPARAPRGSGLPRPRPGPRRAGGDDRLQRLRKGGGPPRGQRCAPPRPGGAAGGGCLGGPAAPHFSRPRRDRGPRRRAGAAGHPGPARGQRGRALQGDGAGRGARSQVRAPRAGHAHARARARRRAAAHARRGAAAPARRRGALRRGVR